MSLVLVARITALALSVSTFVFLFLHDSWRSDNLFLVPDLLLCAGLALAATLPAERAVPYLLIAFGSAAGIFATSVSWYAVDGRLGAPSLLGAVASLVLAVALARRAPLGSSHRDRGGSPTSPDTLVSRGTPA